MYFLGFDPKSLSNEELFEKQLELNTKKIMAARFGKVDAVNQLHGMIQAIEFERRERMFVDRIGTVMLSTSSVLVESDPSLREQQTEVDDQKPRPAQVNRPVRRSMRTTQPVTPKPNGV